MSIQSLHRMLFRLSRLHLPLMLPASLLGSQSSDTIHSRLQSPGPISGTVSISSTDLPDYLLGSHAPGYGMIYTHLRLSSIWSIHPMRSDSCFLRCV